MAEMNDTSYTTKEATKNENLECIYEYDVHKPLNISLTLKNKCGYDLYFNKYGSPFDSVRNCWRITDENGKVAKYVGVMKKRLPASKNTNAWELINKDENIKENIKIPFDIKGLNAKGKYNVECTSYNQIQITKPNKIKKKPISSTTINIKYISKQNNQ